MQTKNKPVRTKKSDVVVGNTTYIVTCSYNKDARETADQKFLRLVTQRVSAELKSPKSAVI